MDLWRRQSISSAGSMTVIAEQPLEEDAESPVGIFTIVIIFFLISRLQLICVLSGINI